MESRGYLKKSSFSMKSVMISNVWTRFFVSERVFVHRNKCVFLHSFAPPSFPQGFFRSLFLRAVDSAGRFLSKGKYFCLGCSISCSTVEVHDVSLLLLFSYTELFPAEVRDVCTSHS